MQILLIMGENEKRAGTVLSEWIKSKRLGEPTLWVRSKEGTFQDQVSKENQGSEDAILFDILLLSNEIGMSPTFEDSGTAFLRKIWIDKRLLSPTDPLSPAIILAYEEEKELIQRDSRFSLVCSPRCRVVRKPCSLESVAEQIKTSIMGSDESRTLTYLFPARHEILSLERGFAHKAGNLLGAMTLITGAFLEHDLSEDDYKKKMSVLIREIEGRSGQFKEYCALRGFEAIQDFKSDEGCTQGMREILQAAKERKGIAGSLRILLIDNEAETGWEDVIAAVCSGANVECISDVRESSAGTLEVKDKDGWKYPSELPWSAQDLVLLDLRLLPKRDEEVDREVRRKGSSEAERFSGMQLLKEISKQDPSLPVILFTASKKFYNVQWAVNLGRVRFFSKEPFLPDDNYIDLASTRELLEAKTRANYREFREHVGHVLSRKRMNLRVIWRAICDLDKDRSALPPTIMISDITIGYLKRAFVLCQQESDTYESRVAGRHGCAPEALLNVANAAEPWDPLQKDHKRQLVSAVREGDNIVVSNSSGDKCFKEYFESKLFWNRLLQDIRGSAAHATVSLTITFEDVMIAFVLFFKCIGRPVTMMGYEAREWAVIDAWQAHCKPPGRHGWNSIAMFNAWRNAQPANLLQLFCKYHLYFGLAHQFDLDDGNLFGMLLERFRMGAEGMCYIKHEPRGRRQECKTPFGWVADSGVDTHNSTLMVKMRPEGIQPCAILLAPPQT